MDYCKGVTGIGFDRETRLFTALEEWRDNLKSTNKIGYKFKTKPLEHEELMREVFTGATATGKHHWTLGEKAVDVGEGESNSVDSLGLVPFTEHTDWSLTHLQTPSPSTLKKQAPGQRGKREVALVESRRRSLVEHRCLWIVLTICLRRHEIGASQKYGIEPCMQRLMAIPDFISTPLFYFSYIALENADYQKILMCMPDDENVVGWLAALQASKGLSHQQIMWKGESSNHRNYDDVIIEQAEEEEDLQNSVIGDAAQHAIEYYLKYMEKIPCRTSILTGCAWIQELFDGHVGRGE
ncbi:hypothetical protein ACSBR1_030372 [Camellia fascicularis]